MEPGHPGHSLTSEPCLMYKLYNLLLGEYDDAGEGNFTFSLVTSDT